ncbi:MAG: hypothetical protein IVW36_05630 [Dehalococcoidia bacterium]|nr:hypothetical protein [Dehalococcoidia bacterium]
MQFLWQRYTRSGYTPPWFYALIALGFLALAAWGAFKRDWTIMAIALVMVGVTAVGSRVMRRLSAAAEASRRQVEADGKDEHDG